MQAKDSSPPDGGYGWVVVVSAFIVMGLTVAVLKTFGLFFVEIQEHFDELASTTSWITSVTIAIFHLGAPVASSLCVRYTHRAVVITGGLLAFSGMALGCLGLNMIWMYATTGFLQGLGISFSWTPAISIVSHYFSKKRALANAIASAGESAFAFTFGPFFQWLISQYGWKGALLIIGGIQLNICVCGALMRPLASSCLLEASHSETETPAGDGESRTNKDQSPITHKTFNWMLVRQPEFVLYAIFGLLAAMSFFVPPLFLVPLSYSLGIDESWTASLLSILATVDFAGRLLCGWYANLHITRTVHLLTMTIALISTSLMLLPLANNYLSLAIFTGFYGFFFGTTVAVHITVLADVAGMPDFDSALGLFMLIRSAGGFVGPPLAGLIVDMAGDYRAGFYMAGATLVLSAGFLVTLDQLQQKKERSSQPNTKPKKPTLLYPSLHLLKLQNRRYQEHSVVV
ncbi:monocarboxylate transporter 13-like [Falco rusticolus]|uniref:monocarboxylate transporter 13-like n=1 Tax=Falco cherrug TaxID=345164 RepID=UPI000392EF69|nr:monocarboxylate transporter 13-like [Falco cherrug]XP_037228531.1 monocarboxylate transporter 13-like [Falco rusticolus]